MCANPTLSRITVIFLFAALVFSTYLFFPNNILSWDVFGYYLYLPLTFIYHDLGIHNYSALDGIINTYHNTATFYQGVQMPSGEWIIKYTSGMAILYSPFFFIGHAIANIFNYPTDGFSAPYQYAVLIGSLIYTFIGIVFLRKILLKFFNEIITSISLVIVVLGTNFFLHTSMHGQGAMTHNYLFTLYALIVWHTIKWHEQQTIKNIFVLGIVCGLATLIRPTEIVSILLPLCWGIHNKETLNKKISLLFNHRRQIVLFIITVFCIGFIQCIYWKRFTGSFLFYSYDNAGEGFEFTSPYFLEVLFSFRKGWLIYTPIMIFSLLGFYILYKKNKNIFPAILIYFLINFFIVASWSCWWYADCFGQRALIPSYVVLAIPLGYFISAVSSYGKITKILFGSAVSFFILLNLFQSWQITEGILHTSRTTREYYFRVFGKKDVTDEDKRLLLVDRPADGNEIFRDADYVKTMVLKKDYEIIDNDTLHYKKNIFHSGSSCYMLDSTNTFSPPLTCEYKKLTSKSHAWLRVRIWIYPVVDPSQNPTDIIVAFEHHGFLYKYKATGAEKLSLELNKWNLITINYLTPEVRRKNDALQVFVWHRGKEKIFVDDIEVEVFEPKFDPSIF